MICDVWTHCEWQQHQPQLPKLRLLVALGQLWVRILVSRAQSKSARQLLNHQAMQMRLDTASTPSQKCAFRTARLRWAARPVADLWDVLGAAPAIKSTSAHGNQWAAQSACLLGCHPSQPAAAACPASVWTLSPPFGLIISGAPSSAYLGR
jgi:hypothetical protein